MARPWRPEEPRRPKPSFYKKPKAEKRFPGKKGALCPTTADPYQDGMLRMFLDDERPCPPGFTLYRTLDQFQTALQAADLSRIYAISLDWHLGATDRGTTAAETLAEMLANRRAEFSELRIITCHSTDIEQAAKMARTIAKPIYEERFSDDDEKYPYIIVDVGKAVGKL